MAASEATPKQLKMGTKTRHSVTTLHATFGNSTKLAYERGKVLKGTKPGSSMAEILSFLAEIEKVEEDEYLRSSSFSPADAHLTFQNPEMVAIINAAYHPLQSDSVEGFIEDLEWNKDVTITITSTYDEILKKSIIVCLTIMFGKSAKHYHKHFMAVLKSYDKEDSAEVFIEKFPGNTCDFSDAERVGFFSAMTAYLKQSYGMEVEHTTLMSLYRFCNVHFMRSMTRVARNHGVIPHAKEEDFQNAVASLREFGQGDFDKFEKACIEFFKSFPIAKNWLKWYLHPDWAPIFFDACKSLSDDQWQKACTLDPDTNAQENVGKQYQETFGKKQKANLGEAINHTWCYLNLDRMDRAAQSFGLGTRYGDNTRKTKKRKSRYSQAILNTPKQKKKTWEYTNDGRAPDTSDSLITKMKKRQNKTKHLKEQKSSIVTLNEPCIPWNTADKSLPIQFKNTCRVDSVLQCFVYLIRNNLFLKPLVEMESEGSLLALSFNQVELQNFDEARNLVWSMFLKDSKPGEESEINKTRHLKTVDWWGQAVRLFDGNDGISDGFVSESCKWTFKIGSVDCSNENCPLRHRYKKRAGRIVNNRVINIDTNGTIVTALNNKFGEKFDPPCPFVTGSPDLLAIERDLINQDDDGITVLARVDNTGLCPGSYELKMKDEVRQFPHLAVFSMSMNDRNVLSSSPILFSWREQSFILRGAILGTSGHFTAAMRDKNFWVFYDGIGGVNGHGRMLRCYPEDIDEMVKPYQVTLVIYETVDKENKQSAEKEYEVWLDKDPQNDSTIPANTSDTVNKQSKKNKMQKSQDDIQHSLKELASKKKAPKKKTSKAAVSIVNTKDAQSKVSVRSGSKRVLMGYSYESGNMHKHGKLYQNAKVVMK
eukprot:scaffold62242_cov57-Attheya_sp.AAC.1